MKTIKLHYLKYTCLFLPLFKIKLYRCAKFGGKGHYYIVPHQIGTLSDYKRRIRSNSLSFAFGVLTEKLSKNPYLGQIGVSMKFRRPYKNTLAH